jgi:hypothetical protein
MAHDPVEYVRQMMRQPSRYYFFLPEAKPGCHPPVFWLGAAAIVLIFSFLGFLASRLPFCLPLAMPISLWVDDEAVVKYRISR